MPRQPKLRKKAGYWHTEAGNPSGVRFGRVDCVPYGEAKRRFADYLKSLAMTRSARRPALTVECLTHEFLEWVERKRSFRTYDERKRHLNRFCAFGVGSGVAADLNAIDVTASDLERFIKFIKAEHATDDFTADKHAVSVKAMFNWARRHPSPQTHLPREFRPFDTVEKYKRPDSSIREEDLPTREEVAALLKWADADLEPVRDHGPYRQRQPDEYRRGDANPYRGFEDMLRCYYHTGARTGELAQCTVRDFSRSARVVVLRTHKRSKTLKNAETRIITPNAEMYEILSRRCDGRGSDDPIFTDPSGRPWDTRTLAFRFSHVRTLASVRKTITIYSFRHLWISEALMSGTDVATVAKMAGTSISMIERVYGHFSKGHFHEAQERLYLKRQSQPRPESQPVA